MGSLVPEGAPRNPEIVHRIHIDNTIYPRHRIVAVK